MNIASLSTNLSFGTIILCIIVTLLTGCTTAYNLSPIISTINSQELFYADGKQVAISRLNQTEVCIWINKTADDEFLLHLVYRNNSTIPINVFPEQIHLEWLSKYEGPKRQAVYSSDKYLSRLRKQQAWANVASAIGAAAESYGAGRSKTYGTVSGQPVYLETYDPAKKAMVDQKNSEEMARQVTQQSIIYAATEQGLLKSNTLLPGYYVEGNVMARFSYQKRIAIVVPFGEVVHRFEFVAPAQ
ncbi:MAG: hypothetical protein FJY67_01535 [Calditrichaeota bacterium]|nr:hypothetical protein [Calditrichota bacterium]